MSMIEVNNITKDYGDNKGVFDVSFHVEKGEVVGFLGPNGSGKTTTIRQLMGFIKADKGSVHINGMDCFTKADEVQALVGYLPGEIAFMDEMSGMEFIEFVAKMKNIKDMKHAKDLISFLELDPRGKMKRMSKGMKQKIGLVIAFMDDAPILLLDEPTSGLDPLMQNKFIELVEQSKKAGKTILMSSHIFEEVEHTCDRVVIIKEGKIIAVEEMDKLRNSRHKHYEIRFQNKEDAAAFATQFPSSNVHGVMVRVSLQGQVDAILKALAKYKVEDINARTQSLEELFLHFYGGEK